VRAHSSSRRQEVVAEPQPSSLAGNSAQRVEVRAMNTSAATQLWSGMRRGTPPRGAWRWRWEQRLDALPQRIREGSVHETGHGPEHPKTHTNRSTPLRADRLMLSAAAVGTSP
jgi:hypothetical protein